MGCTLVTFLHFSEHYPFHLSESLLQKILVLSLKVFSISHSNRHEDHPTWLLLHTHSSHSNNSFLLVIISHDIGIVAINFVNNFFLDELGTKPMAIKVY